MRTGLAGAAARLAECRKRALWVGLEGGRKSARDSVALLALQDGSGIGRVRCL